MTEATDLAAMYRTEFAEYVAKRLPKGDWAAPVVAAKIVTELRRKRPDLLAGWLDANAEQFITSHISTQDRIARQHRASDAPRSAFRAAADKFEAGDSTAFDLRFVINANNLRRRVGDMSKSDHLYVAGEHDKRSASALFEAAFHRAIAKRIPNGKTTSDVLTEDEYLRLRDSITA
jgi:hypothetical protein